MSQASSNWARLKNVNTDGYCDTDEFKVSNLKQSALKILAIGDSFTWGASANEGNSFIEQLEGSEDEMTIWNASIPATGVSDYKRRLEAYGPEMTPDIVLLGICYNDIYRFSSNILRTDSGRAIFHNGSNIEDACERIIAQIHSELKKHTLLGFELRLFALINNFRATGIKSSKLPEPTQIDIDEFSKCITEIQTICSDLGSELIVLNIPDRFDILSGGPLNKTILNIFSNQGIRVLDPTEMLSPKEDYRALPDAHWNDKGHLKAAQLLRKYLKERESQNRPK